MAQSPEATTKRCEALANWLEAFTYKKLVFKKRIFILEFNKIAYKEFEEIIILIKTNIYLSMKLVAFDLDFTLWNAGGQWIDQSSPPFIKKNGIVCDSLNRKLILYPDTMNALHLLRNKTYIVAAVSRTYEPGWARELLRLYDLKKYFHYLKIFPDSKIVHFRQLHRESGIPFEEMLFFDDEMRNIEEVSSLGVKSVLVNEGISMEILKESIHL